MDYFDDGMDPHLAQATDWLPWEDPWEDHALGFDDDGEESEDDLPDFRMDFFVFLGMILVALDMLEQEALQERRQSRRGVRRRADPLWPTQTP